MYHVYYTGSSRCIIERKVTNVPCYQCTMCIIQEVFVVEVHLKIPISGWTGERGVLFPRFATHKHNQSLCNLYLPPNQWLFFSNWHRPAEGLIACVYLPMLMIYVALGSIIWSWVNTTCPPHQWSGSIQCVLPINGLVRYVFISQCYWQRSLARYQVL